jgi:hypothetical protein
MSTGNKSAEVKIVGNGVSTNPDRPRVTASKKELRAAIDRLWMEMHLSKHPLDKVRLYEEIKMLENEISSTGDGD